MNDTYYFAHDGSYGLWEDGSILTDTSQWTIHDWEEIENCTDSERSFVARGIISKYTKIGGVI